LFLSSKIFIKNPESLAIPNRAKLKIFGVFKARTNELSLEIPIFSEVPAGSQLKNIHKRP
jgi:hypothetical protein